MYNFKTNIHSNKTTYDIQRRRNAQLTRKSHSFFKIFMKRIYKDIFLYMSCIPGRD